MKDVNYVKQQLKIRLYRIYDKIEEKKKNWKKFCENYTKNVGPKNLKRREEKNNSYILQARQYAKELERALEILEDIPDDSIAIIISKNAFVHLIKSDNTEELIFCGQWVAIHCVYNVLEIEPTYQIYCRPLSELKFQ